jgi:excisionase family DNA binding protein
VHGAAARKKSRDADAIRLLRPTSGMISGVRGRYLTSNAVARLVGVSPSTVLGWIDRGLLPGHRTPGGHRRVERAAVVRFLREHEMPVPQQLLPTSKVLVMDDDQTFLRSVKRMLHRAAPELVIETARRPADGLLRLVTFSPDAILLDVDLPDIEGVALCKRLRTAHASKHIRVVALTSEPSTELRRSYERAGAAAFLVKPLDLTKLLVALDLAEPQRTW